MDLLPRSHTEFVSKDYWDKFYKKRGTKAFEWYGEYPELCGILGKYVKTSDKILMVGCGNSRLGEDMYDVGYTNIVNIDISDVVIRQMTEKNKEKRPNMVFSKMDVTQTKFSDGEFSVAIDKGTLDAMMSDFSEAVTRSIWKMFTELCRVLRHGGRYICISLLQEHIAQKLFAYFIEEGWPVRVHRVETAVGEDGDRDFALPAFVIVLTKFKKIPNMKPILEVASTVDKMERHDSLEKLRTVVKEMQYYAIVKQQISKRNVGEDQPSLCLYDSTSSEPRYTLFVVDEGQRSAQKFAVFIVPQGRESDWMFASADGRKQVAESAGFERLVVVTLDRAHHYTDIEAVKSELSCKVMELSPPGFKKGTQVPFLSVGETIGDRHVHAEGVSEKNGKYVVEDVETDGGNYFRRLIFLSTPNIIQSEALLSEKSKKKGKKSGYQVSRLSLDHTFLACDHHVAMIGSLTLLPQSIGRDVSVLLIGLGGGGLPGFIRHHLHQVILEVVDFDPDVLEIAEKHFFFKQDDRLTVHIADGVAFIHEAAALGKIYDVVMFDVDSKDTSTGISCPPLMFLEEEFLKQTASLLGNNGVFVVNLVARNEDLKKTILDRLRGVFPTLMSVHVEEEVNQIIYCLPGGHVCGPGGQGPSDVIEYRGSETGLAGQGHADIEEFMSHIKYSAVALDKMVKSVSDRTEVDILEAMENLSVMDP